MRNRQKRTAGCLPPISPKEVGGRKREKGKTADVPTSHCDRKKKGRVIIRREKGGRPAKRKKRTHLLLGSAAKGGEEHWDSRKGHDIPIGPEKEIFPQKIVLRSLPEKKKSGIHMLPGDRGKGTREDRKKFRRTWHHIGKRRASRKKGKNGEERIVRAGRRPCAFLEAKAKIARGEGKRGGSRRLQGEKLT